MFCNLCVSLATKKVHRILAVVIFDSCMAVEFLSLGENFMFKLLAGSDPPEFIIKDDKNGKLINVVKT